MADVEAPPPKIDVQDPLPEQNWFWRRIFVFAICTAVFIGSWIEITTMVDLASDEPELIVGAFIKIIKWQFIIAWCAMTYYLIAPSAEQVGKWLATVSAWKSGVSTSTSQIARGPDGSIAQARSIGGPAPITGGPDPNFYGAVSDTGLPANAAEMPETGETDVGADVKPITPEEPVWRK